MLSHLHATCLLVLLFMPTKYNQIISISIGVMGCARFQLQERKLYNEDSKSCLSCSRHTYWSSFSFLPNIIKICLRVAKLWPAQDFGFRGDDYFTNNVRVVSLARDTPTGPPLHPYQILSNYLKQYGGYGLHKISASVR